MDGGKEEARGGWDRGRERGGGEGAREEAMMLCQWRKRGLREGGLMKGTSEEGTERGMDGARGGRKRAEDGLSQEGREHGSKGERETSREVVFTNQPFTNRPLPLRLWCYK